MALETTICRRCDTEATRAYDEAWRVLGGYLRHHWRDVVVRGSFDLSKVFARDVGAQALMVHLFFVKAMGCKLKRDGVDVDLQPLSSSLLGCTPNALITLLVADATASPGELVSHRSDVSCLRTGTRVESALWTYLAHPVAVKVCYLRPGAPVRPPEGSAWHPTRQRKIVKLSPFKGDTQPLIARRDLRI